MNPRITRIAGSRIVGQQYETNTQNKARHRAEQRSPLAGMFDGTEWHPQGLCYRHPHPEWWFPEVGGSAAKDAKAICAQCPVASECLEWALKYPQEYGLYGGVNYKQRRRIRTKRNAALRVDGTGDPLGNGHNSQTLHQ